MRQPGEYPGFLSNTAQSQIHVKQSDYPSISQAFSMPFMVFELIHSGDDAPPPLARSFDKLTSREGRDSRAREQDWRHVAP
jgi:hypothetical protein